MTQTPNGYRVEGNLTPVAASQESANACSPRSAHWLFRAVRVGGGYGQAGCWPVQDILLLVFVCAGVNHPFITPAHLHYPHYCNTIARLVRNTRPPPDPPWL